jgi:hypothetical protein
LEKTGYKEEEMGELVKGKGGNKKEEILGKKIGKGRITRSVKIVKEWKEKGKKETEE